VRLFVDTSALFAVLDADDLHHSRADGAWKRWLADESVLFVTTNYVVVETTVVAQRRLGMAAVTDLHRDVLPLIHVEWVEPHLHQAAVAALLAARKRGLSLVDCSSFEVMRSLGFDTAFAFDRHFTEHGFSRLP